MTRFRMPAEWTPHDAVWTAWPHLADEWPEGLDAPRRELAALCAALAQSERVELLVREADEAAARAMIGEAAAGHLRTHHVRYGDVWLRDTGPCFVVAGDVLGAARFRFDGWGGKYLMDGDPEVAAYVAREAGARDLPHDFVLEGGAIDVDGAGSLLTTRQCLDARTGGATERDLCEALGVERVIWLDQGIANDHTDGHVDTLARFVAPGAVIAMEPAPGDPNRNALLAILADLRAAGLEVVAVPSPGEVLATDGKLLPASYMNFYIGNSIVVVPTYGAPADDVAVDRIAGCFPERRTIGLPARAVLAGGGAFHCCTQQQPRVP